MDARTVCDETHFFSQPEYQAFLWEKGEERSEKGRERKEKTRKELEGALQRLFEFLSVHKSTICNQNIYGKSFNGFLLPADRSARIYFGSVTSEATVCYPSLPHPDFGFVTRLAEWFWVRPSSLSFPLPPPHLKSPLL